MAAVLYFLEHRLADEHRWLLRHALRWGLPGALFAVQRALGGNPFAWVIAMLGMLTGYTLLAGLEAWLDRGQRRARATSASSNPVPVTEGEWPRLALAPVGPPAEIIELQLPAWQTDGGSLSDPRGGRVDYRDGAYRFDDGTKVDGDLARAAFSPSGRWFAAAIDGDRGVTLRDRDRGKQHRVRGWRLDGWYREQPWLVRREGDMPLALHAVLGEDAASD
ncbi:MAG: hypothetical protein WDW38_011464 [Sanguina aurantia]